MDEIKLYPLTLPQQGFYYDYLLHRNDCKYNMGGHLLLNGHLDVHLFRKAYNYITSKYDALRQRFVIKDGEMFQYFLDEVESNIEFIDFRKEANPYEEAIVFLLAENAKPFLFENTDLHKQIILQTGDMQYIWFPRFHHFADDAYGYAIINEATSHTYNSLLENGTYPEIKSFSYLDFLEDDLKYRESDSFRESLEYWKNKLTPLPEPLDFTVKKHLIKNVSLHNERVTLNLHRMCYSSLLNLGEIESASPFQTILTILTTVIYKLYNKKDVIIGMPVLNRSNYKFKNTPGLFMNMTPLRLSLNPEGAFSDQLNHIKAQVKECYRHQRLPMSETYKHFRNDPDFNNELFDITVVYRKMDFSQRFGTAKLQTVTLDSELRNESFGVEIDEYNDDNNVNIFFNYNPQVLTEQEAVQFARSFETVLFELIYFPETSIGQLNFLNRFEQHRITNTFNSNEKVIKTDKSIVQSFYECAAANMDKAAILFSGGQITYSKLNSQSNIIANTLIEQYKVSSGDIVCLVAERSEKAIAAIIGIMKSGAAVLPVDINNPLERIAFILKDSGAKLLITDKSDLNELHERFVLLDELLEDDAANPNIIVAKHDLAYIIYTSGSTGTPKGVMIEHGSFMNMFVNMIDNFGVKADDRVLQFASLGFDAAIFEIFQALLTGATLAIAKKETIQDPQLFIDFMDKMRVTVATIPPAYLNALDKPAFSHLHTLISAGEHAIVQDINHYKKTKRVINAYGPTEASVCASVYVADRGIDYTDCVPIGNAVPGTAIYILNDNLEVLPVGFAGELCISGPNLARGYLNNPELTVEKFVPDPFVKNMRMYRSGDRARWREDGTIEFLGRSDDQVKIRGNRIELREIENTLKKCSGVEGAIVLVAENGASKDLAAFVTGEPGLSSDTLKINLQKSLPEYMVPGNIAVLEKFPLNNNGKINKKELLNNLLLNHTPQNSGDVPPNNTELLLLPLFENVLNRENIGVCQNIFELGGDSLKIARLITRIKREFNLEITFKSIFDHPTVRGVALLLKDGNKDKEERIQKTQIRDYYPLSHSQKRIWILSQDIANASVYNMPVPVRLQGKVNTDYLKSAVQKVAERHEILRTIFVEIGGVPHQKVLEDYDLVIAESDFSGLSDGLKLATEAINKDAMTPFDLSCEIPVRGRIIKIGDQDYLFLLLIHHIAGDGTSIGLIANEISLTYNSLIKHRELPHIGPPIIQYKDYSVHEEHLILSDKYLKEKSYWLNKLQGDLPAINLPCDRPRPAVKTYNGDYIFNEISHSLSLKIAKYSADNSLSPFMILLASVNLLLHKYSFDKEVITGSPVMGRNIQETEDGVGPYINTLALRNFPEGDKTFSAFLNEVAEVSSEAFSNSNYPFDSLIQDIDPVRDLSRAPLFDVLVQFQDKDFTSLNLNGVKCSFYEIEFKVNKFDLTFTFSDHEGEIKFSIGYNTDLFDRERVEKMALHLNNLLLNALSNSNLTIKEIDILSEDEKATLLDMSTGDQVKQKDRTVVQQLLEQIEKNPQREAVRFADKRLTYKEFGQKVDRLANEILAVSGIDKDDVVAIMANRSENTLVAIFAALKAGAAYMPVGTDLPAERIRFMLEESNAKIIIAEAINSNVRKVAKKIPVIDISAEREINTTAVENRAVPSGLAYVLYTSGSTGTPKGVMVEHKNLYNLVTALSSEIYKDVSEPLNIALISPFVFDASVKQIFYALTHGHCLDIIPDEVKNNGRKLLDYYLDHSINVSDGTPMHLEIITDELALDSERYLPQKFVIGGQQLMVNNVQKLYDATDDSSILIHNVYGPTECCDVSSILTITRELANNWLAVSSAFPIGQPIRNARIEILDPSNSQVPVGVNGELFISGKGVARGYINGEKFGLSYKTGDIGKYLPDGNILLSGRSDGQIKLRGFRIELSEVENCILGSGKVDTCIVITSGEGNSMEIAAYYTLKDKSKAIDLRDYLAQKLPSYMLPAHLVEMDKLPLSKNGKIDKQALPVSLRGGDDLESVSSETDALEERLCTIWSELLEVKRVMPNDNFFALGGHSLTAIRLVSRVHKEFSAEIGIWEVFRYSTVSAMADLLRTKKPSVFSPIENIEKSDRYELSNSQKRLWMLAKLEGQNSLYNLPAALLLNGELDVVAFEKSFKTIIARHESFRTSFTEIDGEPFQIVRDNVEFKVELVDYKGESWTDNTLRVLSDEYFDFEFDLSVAPLLKIRLVKLSEKRHLFLYNMHHIIGDGWSIDVILKEFETYYSSFANGTEPQPKPLKIQYKEYAAWQNRILEGDSLNPVRNYWHEKLKSPRPDMNLPFDFKRTDSFEIDGELVKYNLDSSLAKGLKDICKSANTSLYMALLTVVNVLLHKYTGEDDIIVGSPVAGRQHFDLENQIGFFINTLVLRNEINPEKSFREVLKLVTKNISEAMDNQIYPFDRLVNELDVERIPNRNPLFDVMVAWMVKDGMELKFNFNGVEATGLEFRITKSMFDLTFLFEESNGVVSYSIEYNTSLFKRETIDRISAHFRELTENIVNAPKEKIKNISAVPAAEKQWLLKGLSKNALIPNEQKSVIEVFCKKSVEYSNDLAITCNGRSITYSQLNQLSDNIASEIISAVSPRKEEPIAVIVNDPILAVASMLGVMKTGAAYLPIMADNPQERIANIIKDSNARALLTDMCAITNENILENTNSNSEAITHISSEAIKHISSEAITHIRANNSLTTNVPIIDVRENFNQKLNFLPVEVESDTLAYVIYTSGSTGAPKGVMVEHGSLANLIFSLRSNFDIYGKGKQNELMISSFAFDVSVKQIFATLCHGNTLHILDKEQRLDPRDISRYINEKAINIADITPSLFSVMLEVGFGEAEKPHLKELFLGSEALPYKLVRDFYSYPENKKINLTNFYGPTECCVECSFYRFNPNSLDADFDIAPIGQPVLNENIFILDRYLNLAPTGVPGEICVSGKGLAREYLNDTEKSSQKFVTLKAINNERVYKTGDIGRVLPDGNIEFLGRIDDQVKIRGYRVELQEIESHIRSFRGVNDCVVLIFKNEEEGELAAYFTSDSEVDVNELRRHLEGYLPGYMVPSYFMPIDKIPLSSNGKVNRKHLPPPTLKPNTNSYVPPKNFAEQLVVDICCEVLKKEQLSVSDNFFEVGGNSLNAVRVISHIQKKLNVDIALKHIFYNPLLADFAAIVKESALKAEVQPADDFHKKIIVPLSEEELEMLSNLQFEDED